MKVPVVGIMSYVTIAGLGGDQGGDLGGGLGRDLGDGRGGGQDGGLGGCLDGGKGVGLGDGLCGGLVGGGFDPGTGGHGDGSAAVNADHVDEESSDMGEKLGWSNNVDEGTSENLVNVDGEESGSVCIGTKCDNGAGGECEKINNWRARSIVGVSMLVKTYDVRASANCSSADSATPKVIADRLPAAKSQGAGSQVHSPEMTVNLLFNAEPGVGERGCTSVSDRSLQKEDPNYPVVWGAEDDILVRKKARRLVSKKWELLKLFKNIIDEQAGMLKEMKLSEKIREKVYWNDEDERNYSEWKMKNLKYMSLKESKLKENVKQKVFEDFCERKGLNRKKGIWERIVDDEMKLKENELKEIMDRKKLARSKRKKIELMKESKEKLFGMIESWKETPGMEEERNFKKLKESAMKERIVELLGKKRNLNNRPEIDSKDLPERMTPEDSQRRTKLKEDDPVTLNQEDFASKARPSLSLKLMKTTPVSATGLRKTPRKTTSGRLSQEDSIRKKMTRRGHGGNSPVAKSFVKSLDLKPNSSVKRLAERIETSQQINLTPTTRVCGQQPNYLLTKPHFVYSSVGVQMPSKPLCTGPSNQWEESSGTSLRSTRPAGQSDLRNEQTHEQKLQNGLRRKDSTRPASTQ